MTAPGDREGSAAWTGSRRSKEREVDRADEQAGRSGTTSHYAGASATRDRRDRDELQSRDADLGRRDDDEPRGAIADRQPAPRTARDAEGPRRDAHVPAQVQVAARSPSARGTEMRDARVCVEWDGRVACENRAFDSLTWSSSSCPRRGRRPLWLSSWAPSSLLRLSWPSWRRRDVALLDKGPRSVEEIAHFHFGSIGLPRLSAAPAADPRGTAPQSAADCRLSFWRLSLRCIFQTPRIFDACSLALMAERRFVVS